MGLTDFLPLVRVKINGSPLSGLISSQLNSVSVTDEAGIESDTAELVFTNVSPAARFIMPDPGAEVQISLGYLGKFKDMGVYIADDIEEASPPRSITAVCRAKAQGQTEAGYAPIHQQKTRSWSDDLTLEDIVNKMAGENGLEPGITDAAASIQPGHIDQIDESDLSVLTRIAVAHDLVAKPAGGVLYVGKKGESTQASGGEIPGLEFLETNLSSWSMRKSQGEAAGTVIATYRDMGEGADIEVKVGDGEPVRRLRQRFRDEAEAQAAADAEARRSARAEETLEFQMPGNPNVAAEGKITLIGLSSSADGKWLVKSVTHNLSSSGYQTSVQCERPE